MDEIDVLNMQSGEKEEIKLLLFLDTISWWYNDELSNIISFLLMQSVNGKRKRENFRLQQLIGGKNIYVYRVN